MNPTAGFLIVDKPKGSTSFSMVRRIRRLTGVRRVGHAGTLDPLATGVLPVAVGPATRLIEYLDDTMKAYSALVRFGVATDTYDAEGKVVATHDPSGLSSMDVAARLESFRGEIEQRPPVYSAIKVAGKALYRYARAGEEVEVRKRSVFVEAIRLLGFQAGSESTAELEIVCSKGTYVRSIAHDLGQMLGCGAHLQELRRTMSGGFSLADASAMDKLEDLAAQGMLGNVMLAPDRAVERRMAAILGADHARDLARGRQLRLVLLNGAEGQQCRAYDTLGDFLGMIQAEEGGFWRAAKVLGRR